MEAPLKYKTWVLKVPLHCEGCKEKVRKVLKSIDGVYTTTVDLDQQKVTVIGDVDVDKLIKKLLKNGKRAELWPEKEDKAGKKAAPGKGKENADGGNAVQGNPGGNGGDGGGKKKGSGGADGGGQNSGNGGGANTSGGGPTSDGGNPGGGGGKKKKEGSGGPTPAACEAPSEAAPVDSVITDGGNPGGGGGKKKKGGSETSGNGDGGGPMPATRAAPCKAAPADGRTVDGANPGVGGGSGGKKKSGRSADAGGQNTGDGGAANSVGGDPMPASSGDPAATADGGGRAGESNPGGNGGGGKKKDKKGGQNSGDGSAANAIGGDSIPAASGTLIANPQGDGPLLYPALHPPLPQQYWPPIPPVSGGEGSWTTGTYYSTTAPLPSYGGSHPLPPSINVSVTLPYGSGGAVRYAPSETDPRRLEEYFSEENATGCSVM